MKPSRPSPRALNNASTIYGERDVCSVATEDEDQNPCCTRIGTEEAGSQFDRSKGEESNRVAKEGAGVR